MKSKKIKLTALVALLTGSCFLSAQNIKTGSAFAIDKNIISFEVANLVDKRISEHPSTPDYGGPNAFSPHIWTITLIMAEGTDVTSLTPIITLATSTTLMSSHSDVQDFSRQVDYTILSEDGSIVIYSFLAYAQENKRGQIIVTMYNEPPYGAGYTNPMVGVTDHSDDKVFYGFAVPYAGYQFERWETSSPATYGGQKFYSNPLTEFFTDNFSITAFFKEIALYTVTVKSEDISKGTVSGGGTCYAGGYVTFSASPNTGYEFDGWYLGGYKVSSSEITNYYYPSASCTLTAKFNLSPPVISGYSTLCLGSQKTFSASNWQSGYTWNSSSNLSLSSSNSYNPTVTANSTGAGWVSVLYDGKEVVMDVWVGIPSLTSISGGPYAITNVQTTYTAVLNSLSSTDSFDWLVTPLTGGSYYLTGQGYKSAYITFYDEGYYQVGVKATNTCGTTPSYLTYLIFVNSRSTPSGAFAYPNPADNILTVDLDIYVALFPPSLSAGVRPTYDVRLYDGMGSMLHQQKALSGILQFDLSNLPNGIYYLHVYDGVNKTPTMVKIIIQH